MNGYDRLKQLYKAGEHKDEPLIKIIKHLLRQSDMSDCYLKKEKNLTQMMEFISDKAKEQAINQVAVIEDETVYGWAVDYFSRSNEELGINPPKPKSTPKAVKEKPENTNAQLSLGV